jgi:hypothetical protein
MVNKHTEMSIYSLWLSWHLEGSESCHLPCMGCQSIRKGGFLSFPGISQALMTIIPFISLRLRSRVPDGEENTLTATRSKNLFPCVDPPGSWRKKKIHGVGVGLRVLAQRHVLEDLRCDSRGARSLVNTFAIGQTWATD